MTKDETTTRPNTCPACGVVTQVPRVWLWGQERFSSLQIYCDGCYAEASRQEAEAKAAEAWERMLGRNLPPRYLGANAGEIRNGFSSVVTWRGQPSGGLGLVGPSDAGKSSAVACLLKALRWPFLWWSGTNARQAAVDAATADKDRQGARERWEHGMTIPLLVLDDISQAKFTESWASSLFDLLETRLANNRSTLWTSQLSVIELRAKIAKQGGEDEQAGAICRRLEQHSLIITA